MHPTEKNSKKPPPTRAPNLCHTSWAETQIPLTKELTTTLLPYHLSNQSAERASEQEASLRPISKVATQLRKRVVRYPPRDPKQHGAKSTCLDAAVIANVRYRRGGGRGRILTNGRRTRNETGGGRVLALRWAARDEVLAKCGLVERERVLGALDRAVPEILAKRILHLTLPGGRVAQGFAGAVGVVAGREG